MITIIIFILLILVAILIIINIILYKKKCNYIKYGGDYTCAVCGKPAESACANCHSVYYCSRACQISDWKKHKKICDDLKKNMMI